MVANYSIFVILLIGAFWCHHGNAQPDCTANETLIVNATYSERSCYDLHQGKCGITSVDGECICNEGYARNSTGFCIEEQDCLCGGNATRTGFTEGNFWEDLYCWNIEQGSRGINDGSCHCNPGYVYDNNQNCILAEDCLCGGNQTRDDFADGYFTDRYCSSPLQGYKAFMDGSCHCKDGYYRNNAYECVLLIDCESGNGECGGNQTRNETFWDISCYNLESGYYGEEGSDPYNCHCILGFARNDSWECVHVDHCECGGNQTRYESEYEWSCYNLNYQYPISYGACGCAEGYARNNSWECVLKTDCACGPNETRDKFFNETYCYNPGSGYCGEPDGSCHCIEGFKRDNYGICVPENSECPDIWYPKDPMPVEEPVDEVSPGEVPPEAAPATNGRGRNKGKSGGRGEGKGRGRGEGKGRGRGKGKGRRNRGRRD